MASRSRLGLYASLLLVTGCFSAGGGSCNIFPPNGLAGNGSFDYECVGDGIDPECDRGFGQIGADLPSRPIARTASFRLTFLGDGTKTVQAVSPNAVSGASTFKAERAGTVGFFVTATNASNDTIDVEDAIRLTVVDPDGISITRLGVTLLGESEKLSVGATQRFRVTAFDKGGPLAGAVAGAWAIEPEGIVELETDRFGTCTVRGIAPGKVRLSAKAAGLDASVTLEVSDSIVDDDAGTDASSDAASDVTTDATTDGGATDASQD